MCVSFLHAPVPDHLILKNRFERNTDTSEGTSRHSAALARSGAHVSIRFAKPERSTRALSDTRTRGHTLYLCMF